MPKGLLSLDERPEEPAPRLKRAEALFVSLGLHIVLLLLVLFVPGRIPSVIVALLNARLPSPPAYAVAEVEPDKPEGRESEPIPLRFTYVKIPDEAPVDSNPTAPFLSDANRRAQQEVPTPPDATQFSVDPHSEGDSLDRVRPDPRLPEGRDEPEPSAPPGQDGETAEMIGDGLVSGDAGGDSRGEGVSTIDTARLPGEGPEGIDQQTPPSDGGAGGLGPDVDPGVKLQQALGDVLSGEYKFTFHNPAYLRQGTYGTLSFDTQEFPWGDYAKIVYVAVLNNWLDRMPLAAREGVRGFACVRFVIERDGSISEIVTVRPSRVRPFNRAATAAIRATVSLPPLPDDFPHPREGVTGCFFYNMHPSEAGFD